MVHYIIIYVASISVSLSGGCVVWRQQRNISGLFFFSFTFFLALFFTFGFAAYNIQFTDEILIYVSRFLLGIGVIVGLYLFLSIYYLGDDSNIQSKMFEIFGSAIFSVIILWLYVGTPWIVQSTQVDAIGDFFVGGRFYPLHVSLYILIVFLLIDISFQKMQEKSILGYLAFIEDLVGNISSGTRDSTSDNTTNRSHDILGVISHEIRSPISHAILQSENILEGLHTKNISPKKLKNEIQSLSQQLIYTQDLLTKLFSVYYYDTRKVQLTGQLVSMDTFLRERITHFLKYHPSIVFHIDIENSIPEIILDEIQFEQVITNILENAVKFLYLDHPIIAVSLRKVHEDIELIIEDDGCGFKGIQISDLFEKYTTGEGGVTGIGMGLYLCKKIVTLHHGTIVASNSEKYTGAKFTIRLPING